MPDEKDRLRKAWALVESESEVRTLSEIIDLLGSASVEHRLQAILAAQWFVEHRDHDLQLLDGITPLLNDADETCRWQAGIFIGLFIATEPEQVWNIVKIWGAKSDSLTQTIVATTVLEHLLEAQPRMQSDATALAEHSPFFRETLRQSWHSKYKN